MHEQWKEYIPNTIPKGNYEVISVTQDSKGTIIVVQSDYHNITISFEFADALRICDEGRRIKTYNEAEGIQLYRKDFYGTPLYQVINSRFYDWLVQESAGFYTEFNHYAIVTLNDIVDIISSSPPEILIESL